MKHLIPQTLLQHLLSESPTRGTGVDTHKVQLLSHSSLLHLLTLKDKWSKSKEVVKNTHHCLRVFILIIVMVSNKSYREIKDLHILSLNNVLNLLSDNLGLIT